MSAITSYPAAPVNHSTTDQNINKNPEKKGFFYYFKVTSLSIFKALKYIISCVTCRSLWLKIKKTITENRNIKLEVSFNHRLKEKINEINITINKVLSVENKDNINIETLMHDCNLFTAKDYINQSSFTATPDSIEIIYQLLSAEIYLQLIAVDIKKTKLDLIKFNAQKKKNKLDLFTYLLRNKITELKNCVPENSNLIGLLDQIVTEPLKILPPKSELEIFTFQQLTGEARDKLIHHEAVKSVIRQYAHASYSTHLITKIQDNSKETIMGGIKRFLGLAKTQDTRHSLHPKEASFHD